MIGSLLRSCELIVLHRFSATSCAVLFLSLCFYTGVLAAEEDGRIQKLKIGDVEVRYVQFDPLNIRVAVVGPETHGANGTNFITDKGSNPRLIAMVNGGYLSSFAPIRPLGLVRINGKNISSPINTWVGAGMICIDDKTINITDFSYQSASSFRDCVQSGPLIIHGSKNRYDSVDVLPPGEKRLWSSNQDQSFACIDIKNRFVLGYAASVALTDLVPILIKSVMCKDAIRFSSGDTAALLVGGKVYGSTDHQIHNAIGVYKK